jgi:hypothetical protein
MLLDAEFVNKPEPKEVWLQQLDPNAVIHEPADTTVVLRSRVKKLRRMQSQNFIQRTVYNVADMVGLHRQSA